MDGSGLDPVRARRLYDRIGQAYDLASLVEGRARQTALQMLQVESGQRVLNAGSGTGRGSAAIEERLPPGAALYSTDLSTTMTRLSASRTSSPVLISDITRTPFRQGAFDWIWSAFVLDLLPVDTVQQALLEFRRILAPGGRLLLISMTDGVDSLSRTVMGAWRAVYRLHPYLCAGCRPLDLAALIQQAGMSAEQTQVVVQLGFPAQVLLAQSGLAPQAALHAAA